MARQPLQPVSRGQRIELIASEHNAFIDAALATKRGERRVPVFDSGGIGLMPTSPTVIRVRNGTAGLGPGTDFDRFDIVGLSEPIFLPEESEPSFINETGFKAVIPLDPTHVGRFAVLLEPLAIGRIGRAVIAGMVTCRIADATAVAGDGLDIKHNDRTGLTRTPGGAATLLWRESGSGGWGLVHLGLRHPSTSPAFLARISVNSVITADEKWLYNFAEGEYNGTTWSDLTGGRGGTCENTHEDLDPDVFENLDCTEETPPEGFIVLTPADVQLRRKPIPNMVVPMFENVGPDGTKYYFFEKQNPVCVFCAV